MDRNIVYPGSIPLDSDLLNTNRNTMVAFGYLMQMALGTGTVVDGLLCTPTIPPSLAVTVGAGSILQASVVDALAYGSLPADATDPLVKMGVNLSASSFSLSAPTTSGESVNYLIQAALQESDINPIVLPYYNAANPSQPYSGPNNSGSAQNTSRVQRVQLQLKAGAAAGAGTQTTPPVDNGWVGLYVVSLNYGQSQITSSSINTLPGAPFLQFKLPALVPGFSRQQFFASPGTTNFVVPSGVSVVQAHVWGGGGGSPAGTDTYASSGGGGGGYARKRVAGLTPGQVIPVTVGGGGGAGTTNALPGAGGSSSFGSYVSATGGQLNGGLTVGTPVLANLGGYGVGGDVNFFGGWGTQPFTYTVVGDFGGMGGDAALGGGGTAGNVAQSNNGQFPGGGGGGVGKGTGSGQAGAAGLVIVEY